MVQKTDQKKVAIITGGSGVIGSAVVRALAAANYTVVIIGTSTKNFLALKKSFQSPVSLEFCKVDVTNAQAVLLEVKKIVRRFKRIDVVVNAAAVLGPVGVFHTNKQSLWQRVIEVNLFGTINVCAAVLPVMISQQAGKIINFSGGGAVQPFPNFSAYATSKAAVVRFTENLAEEYKQYNIQINAIAPGIVNSKMLDQTLQAGAGRAGKEYYNKVKKQKQQGGDSPNLAADLIMFLSDPKNKLTGKLVSAKWDSWKNMGQEEISFINESSLYTLRRIDNQFYKEIRRQ